MSKPIHKRLHDAWRAFMSEDAAILVAGEFHAIARDPRIMVFGPGIVKPKIIWEDVFKNQVMSALLTDMLQVEYASGTQKTNWYFGVINYPGSTPTISAGDTAASHAGWTENVTYSEGNRQAWSPSVSAGVATNSGSPATITASGSITLYGNFIISDNTKSGTSGVLAAAGAFSGGNQVLSSSQTLSLSYRQSLTA